VDLGPAVVVVGGGSAGCIVAARLSEDPQRSVLLLEAGPDYPDLDSMPEVIRGRNGYTVHGSVYNWTYQANYLAGRAETRPMTRGKVIGGSGSVNGSMFVRGLPEDYDAWGSPLWSWQAVLPFFRKLETDLDFGGELHGKEGPIPVGRLRPESWLPFQAAFYESARAAGIPEQPDINDPSGWGVGPIPRNDPDGIRVSAAIGHLLPARGRHNLAVEGDCTVSRVLFEGGRAVGVEGVQRGRPFRVRAGEVVLCAGAIATPQLLLLSGLGPADALRNLGVEVLADLPGVGQNLRDHAIVTVDVRFDPDRVPNVEAPRNQTMLVTTASGSPTRRDLFLVPYSGFASEPDPVTGVPPLVGQHLILRLELPVGSGTLSLLSADPAQPPCLDFRLLEEQWDRSRMREAVRLGADLLEGSAWKGVAEGMANPDRHLLGSDATLDAWIRGALGTALHSCGTCRLGADADPLAVVDDGCRVRGVAGLRVADLSIAPNVPRGNTNATAMMIGERAAALIAGAR
jgi:choline dehydrogenase